MEDKVLKLINEARDLIRAECLTYRGDMDEIEYSNYLEGQLKLLIRTSNKFEDNHNLGPEKQNEI